jgi:hypothetical protein
MCHCTSTFTVKINPEHPGPLVSESDPESFPFSSNPHNLRVNIMLYPQLLHFPKDFPREIMYLIAPQL